MELEGFKAQRINIDIPGEKTLRRLVEILNENLNNVGVRAYVGQLARTDNLPHLFHFLQARENLAPKGVITKNVIGHALLAIALGSRDVPVHANISQCDQGERVAQVPLLGERMAPIVVEIRQRIESYLIAKERETEGVDEAIANAQLTALKALIKAEVYLVMIGVAAEFFEGKLPMPSGTQLLPASLGGHDTLKTMARVGLTHMVPDVFKPLTTAVINISSIQGAANGDTSAGLKGTEMSIALGLLENGFALNMLVREGYGDEVLKLQRYVGALLEILAE